MESTPEQQAEGMAVVRVLSAVLDRLVGANAPLAQADPGQVTKFHALKAPGIGILQYLERIHKYASCSTECFILALIYIDRLIQRNNFLLTELNVHRVVITAVLLAAKFFDDAYYNNAYYAKVGGVLVSEMNGLEVEFLFRINFSLHVQTDVFNKYRAELVAHAAAAGLEQPKNDLPQLPSPHPSPPHAPKYETPGITVPYAPVLQQSHDQVIAPVPVTMVSEASTHEDQFGVVHHAQQITPSPPPPASQAGVVQPQGAGESAGMPTQAYAGLAHTHPGGLGANCQNTPFPQLQRHNSMPVTSTSVTNPARNTAYSMQTSHLKGANVSHLVTPAGAAAALGMGNHNSPYALPNCTGMSAGTGNLSAAERLLAENSAYPGGNQYVSHYQHTTSAGSGPANMMHHYDHTESLIRHITPVVGGSCRYGRRYSDISNYVQEASAPVPMHIPTQASQYVDVASPVKLHAAQMLAGGYGQ
uniref:Cyclin n=1 Tax=Odontella aurita TaxID=265563 RepID=A0A6U6KJT1_9STRA|mmetsp:Transcript_59864/g.177441  ORF Transcript_59864/g.177441 Transcript_59864/m.177441 type:complete len:474 (+) Transcript_59864:784-2205(+)|eukprot:CAMPEP_0113548568 /NCGR_PEP_ID=MMETSP0015_2-20120614/12963_1 /TAXON_ID=2838 /ORGANISM="Odontella" /LENGTH=473 /DNA_ID=CAMNT_0000449207 /DNA_START=1164 /DNA_END=2585 /DNA_ORIENTATION=+ /assembly_acc=CAM_ASM_000160